MYKSVGRSTERREERILMDYFVTNETRESKKTEILIESRGSREQNGRYEQYYSQLMGEKA